MTNYTTLSGDTRAPISVPGTHTLVKPALSNYSPDDLRNLESRFQEVDDATAQTEINRYKRLANGANVQAAKWSFGTAAVKALTARTNMETAVLGLNKAEVGRTKAGIELQTAQYGATSAAVALGVAVNKLGFDRGVAKANNVAGQAKVQTANINAETARRNLKMHAGVNGQPNEATVRSEWSVNF